MDIMICMYHYILVIIRNKEYLYYTESLFLHMTRKKSIIFK